jgi:hypothetical protein
MIRVTIDLAPQGDTSKTRALSRIEIWNDLTGTETHANYRYLLVDLEGHGTTNGEVRGWRRERHHLDLVAQVLDLTGAR